MPEPPKVCHHCRKPRDGKTGQRRGPFWYCNLQCVAAVEGPRERSIQVVPKPKPEPPATLKVVVDWLSLPLVARAEFLQAHGPQLQPLTESE